MRNHGEIATPMLRAIATGVNLFVGIIPCWLIALASEDGPAASGAIWLRFGSIVLAILQTLATYIMSGSFGFAFCGLIVKMRDGTRVTLMATLTRASVFWLWLLIAFADNSITESIGRTAFVRINLVLAMFMIASGVMLTVTGRLSLIDLISGTRVYKNHSIKLI